MLRATLEAIREPAFVVRHDADAITCNEAGRELLLSEPHGIVEQLRQARRGGTLPGLRVTRIEGSGAMLVVMAGQMHEVLSWRASRRWGLSRRQREVVALLAEGRSNRSIGAVLGVSERTVEQHLSSLYERAQVEGRTELMAALLCL